MKNFLIFSILTVAFGCATAAVVKIELPVETATYRQAQGVEVANAQCLTCHSADYASMQPPKPIDFWGAEVAKMKGKYGAPIPDDATNALVTYFAKTYGTDTAPAATAAAFDANILDPHTLATKMGC